MFLYLESWELIYFGGYGVIFGFWCIGVWWLLHWGVIFVSEDGGVCMYILSLFYVFCSVFWYWLFGFILLFSGCIVFVFIILFVKVYLLLSSTLLELLHLIYTLLFERRFWVCERRFNMINIYSNTFLLLFSVKLHIILWLGYCYYLLLLLLLFWKKSIK